MSQLVIEKTFEDAGCSPSDLQTTLPLLAPALINHFASKKAYMLAPGAKVFFDHLRGLKDPPLLGAVSNSDPCIIEVLEDLDVVPRYILKEHIITSWDVAFEKPDSRMLEAALSKIGGGTIKAEETLFIGDDYVTCDPRFNQRRC
jgi:FMN phosphatase YigB (HAD superfamily)